MSRKIVTITYEEVVEALTQFGPSTAVIELHKLVVKKAGYDWERIDKLDGYCVCNKATSTQICRKFIDISKQEPGVMRGGPWLNWGFSCSEPEAETLKEWEVMLPEIVMKD